MAGLGFGFGLANAAAGGLNGFVQGKRMRKEEEQRDRALATQEGHLALAKRADDRAQGTWDESVGAAEQETRGGLKRFVDARDFSWDPLFEDKNGNGIPDSQETQGTGGFTQPQPQEASVYAGENAPAWAQPGYVTGKSMGQDQVDPGPPTPGEPNPVIATGGSVSGGGGRSGGGALKSIKVDTPKVGNAPPRQAKSILSATHTLAQANDFLSKAREVAAKGQAAIDAILADDSIPEARRRGMAKAEYARVSKEAESYYAQATQARDDANRKREGEIVEQWTGMALNAMDPETGTWKAGANMAEIKRLGEAVGFLPHEIETMRISKDGKTVNIQGRDVLAAELGVIPGGSPEAKAKSFLNALNHRMTQEQLNTFRAQVGIQSKLDPAYQSRVYGETEAYLKTMVQRGYATYDQNTGRYELNESGLAGLDKAQREKVTHDFQLRSGMRDFMGVNVAKTAYALSGGERAGAMKILSGWQDAHRAAITAGDKAAADSAMENINYWQGVVAGKGDAALNGDGPGFKPPANKPKGPTPKAGVTPAPAAVPSPVAPAPAAPAAPSLDRRPTDAEAAAAPTLTSAAEYMALKGPAYYWGPDGKGGKTIKFKPA